jgi:hypothetical protein
MTIQAVLLPLFVQVLLTLVLLYWMAAMRSAAFRSGEVHPRDIALREPNWPPRMVPVANAYANALELPVLFYVLVILAWVTRKADLLFVIMSWLFVLSRVVQAWVHVTSNRVSRRGLLFAIGALVLTIMWIIYMVRILLAL